LSTHCKLVCATDETKTFIVSYDFASVHCTLNKFAVELYSLSRKFCG